MRIVALGVVVACMACTRPTGSRTRVQPPAPGRAAVVPPQAPLAIETPGLISRPLPHDPTRTTIHRLSNGMTVYLSPDPQVPTVTAHVIVRAGSRHDPKTSTGLAHYLEHMLFKGTSALGTIDYTKEKPHLDRIAALYAELRAPGAERDQVLAAIDAENQLAAVYEAPNELDQLYARLGITGLNAYTINDATVYTTEVPRNRLAQWARVEAQRYADPVFRLFWPELEAVYEEKNTALDDPEERVQEAMIEALFPDHGYGWGGSVLGEIEHLKAPAYRDMEAFFRRYYTPANMAIVLAGDLDASVLPLLEKEFGAIHRPAGDAAPPGTLTRPAHRTEVEVAVPADEGVLLVWPTVAATHPDALALELMDRVLIDGTYGLLARDLLITQKVATAASDVSAFREAGYFELAADALDGQTRAELETLLLGLVEKLKRGEFSDADLATAVLTYDVDRQRLRESNAGRAAMLTDAFVLGVDWREAVSKVERMRALTKADIVRVATRYLTNEYLAIQKVKRATAPPKISKPAITPVKLDSTRQSVFAKAILAMRVDPIEPVTLVEGTDYRRDRLPTGELVTVRNNRNELFALTLSYDFGRADDRLACLAIGSLDVIGSSKKSADQLAQQLHALAVTIEVSCDKDQTRLTIAGPDRNLEAALALLRERMVDASIAPAAVASRIATVLTERSNQVASPQEIQSAQLPFALYGKASDVLVVASNQQLRAVTPARITKLLARYFSLAHRTAYFGPRVHAAARAAVAFGDGKLATRPPRPVRYRKGNAGFGTSQTTAQTQIAIAWPRKPATDAERAFGTLYSEYVGLLLYQEVREARGLAYSVYGGYGAGRKIDDAELAVYAAVQGDKTDDALAAILGALQGELGDKRLDTAREALAQSYRIDRIAPRAIAETVYAWLDEGETSDPRAARLQRVLAIDKAGLDAWRKAALARPAILSLTGEQKQLRTKPKGLPSVTWVPAKRLFGY